MANINKIKAQGSIYDIEDTVARTSAVVVTSKPDGTVELQTPTSTVTVPSLTNFGDPSELENDVVTEISELKSQIAQLEAIPHAVKLAMDTLFLKMGVKDNAGYTSEYATIHAWATTIKLLSISVAFDQGTNVIYDTDSLETLKQYLTVTATFDDGTISTVSNYTLSGALNVGANVITVTYEDKSATFNVTVEHYPYRVVTASDVVSHIGYSGFTLNSEGTFSATTFQNFGIIEFADTLKHFKYTPSGQMGTSDLMNVIFAKNQDGTFYGYDGYVLYKFTVSGTTKYNATQVTDASSITTITKEGTKLYGDVSEKTITIENGVLTFEDSDSKVTFTNANMYGFWTANTVGKYKVMPVKMEVY